MAAFHDQAVNVFIGDTGFRHLGGRGFQFGFPELFLEAIEFSPELQELYGIEAGCRRNNLLNRAHQHVSWTIVISHRNGPKRGRVQAAVRRQQAVPLPNARPTRGISRRLSQPGPRVKKNAADPFFRIYLVNPEGRHNYPWHGALVAAWAKFTATARPMARKKRGIPANSMTPDPFS
jgi:hypothetical protein